MRLFELERVWAGAALGAVFPEKGPLPHGVSAVDGARFVADCVASAPFEQALALRVALWIVGLAPILLLGRFATFASLKAAEREDVLARLLASRVYAIRQLVLGLKALASMLFARSAAARRAMLGEGARVVPPPLESGFVALRLRRDETDGDGGTRAA